MAPARGAGSQAPLASCSEWHGEGMAGEHDRASLLAAVTAGGRWGEARPGRHQPRWQALHGGAAAPCRLAVAECEAPVRLQRRVGRVVDAAGRTVGPLLDA